MKSKINLNQIGAILKQFAEQLQTPRGRYIISRAATASTVFGVGYVAYSSWTTIFNQFFLPASRFLPAETSHSLAVWACKNNLFPVSETPDDTNLNTIFFGREISNPIGIAAGFDKHGEAIVGLHQVGFGFVEVGSVTPNPQDGNPSPRLFRLEADRAVINRYGFNSVGHQTVLNRLIDVKQNEPKDFVVGVNLGRNRNSRNPFGDYVKGITAFGPHADYLVVNVSSPNTAGLRELQTKEKLQILLGKVNEARSKLDDSKEVPILLKLSPDLKVSEVNDVIAVVKDKSYRIDGLIVANTTTNRENLKEIALASEIGGLSGEPLRKRSTEMIAYIYKLTNGEIPIIGVGGISSGKDAYEKIEAGASYVQFYTALVYDGPEVVTRIKQELSELVRAAGYDNIQEVVGVNYKKYLPKLKLVEYSATTTPTPILTKK